MIPFIALCIFNWLALTAFLLLLFSYFHPGWWRG